MEKNVVRSGKFVKIIGIVTVVIFSLASIFFSITENIIASICFLPFAGLGIVLILAYKREMIIVEDDQLTFCHLFKKPQQVAYRDIRCLLLVPLSNRTQMVLVDRQYRRLIALDDTLVNLEILFEALEQKKIPRVDFGEMVEKKKDVSQYLNALNMIEKNYYKSIADETRIIDSLSKRNKGIHMVKAKKRLKTAGWILLLMDAAAYLIGGKIMVFLLVSVLLASYAIYIRYYPYIYIEATTKKGQENVLQMPFMGGAAALLLCLSVSTVFNYDFVSSLKITLLFTVLLSVPFLVKSTRTEVPQRLGRKASVIFAALVISFTMTFPVNFLLTFDKPVHETMIVTEKDVDTGNSLTDYYLYGNWRGEEKEFSVSRSVYKETSIGDKRTICIKQSVLGLEYYTIHKN